MPEPAPAIRSLALVGDRRTAALVAQDGAIVWYCPGRFDRPSLLAALLDPERGGSWRVEAEGLAPAGRRYLEDSGVLETRLALPGGHRTLLDWLPRVADGGERRPTGLCRLLSAGPGEACLALRAAPDYARRAPGWRREGAAVVVDERQRLYASHPVEIDGDAARVRVPAGEEGWAFLADLPLEPPDRGTIERLLEATLASWRRLASRATYHGPYEREVRQSLRALRLLTHEETGGILAAPTTSLPEVPGGARNYDYRYVWLRDAGMIVSALTRAGTGGDEARRFLDFICSAEGRTDDPPVVPLYTLDGALAPDEVELDLAGYRGARPVRIGNGARAQLQLDALGNVLLAAKLIYNRYGTREHWPVVERIADFLAANWQRPDYGIWEERDERQYTSSKVVVACGLASIAEHSPSGTQARAWRAAVREIREYVAARCLTAAGAYAAVAGGDAVDVSAALFPVWGYTDADAPEMEATMAALERDLGAGGLYRRHLERFDSKREGVFLAGAFWVAQYWVMRNELERARAILDEALRFANDLGLLAEEGDPLTGEMLGNFPQSFVHAALIGAVVDLKSALGTDARPGR